MRNWENDGKIKCFKTLGGHRRFRLEEVKKLLKKMKWELNFTYFINKENGVYTS